MRNLLLTAFALLLFPATAAAQTPGTPDALPAPSLRLEAGGAFPVGDNAISTLYEPGLSFGAGVEAPVSRQLAVAVDFGYSRFFLDDDFLIQQIRFADPSGMLGGVDFDLSGGAFSVFSGTAALKWTFASAGTASFYLKGGPGLYYSTIGDLDVTGRDADGDPVEGEGSLNRDDDGLTVGAQVGAGVQLQTAAGLRLFVEPQVAFLIDDTKFVPVRVGVSFDGLFE